MSYYIHPSLGEGFEDEEDQIKYVIHELSLKSGTVHFDRDYFEVVGITKENKRIVVVQNGEFNMYGGPYEPKMSKPTITLNGKDIYEQVRKCFGGYVWIEGNEELDSTRIDIWSHLLRKEQ